MDSKASFPKWVAKSSKFLINKAKPSSKSFHLFDGLMAVNASAYCASPIFLQAQMEVPENAEGKVGNFIVVETGESSLNSGFLGSEPNLNSGSETSCSSSVSSSSSMGCCPIKEFQKPHFKLHKQASSLSETEMMKERFAKLLLGEDMSGCGNGVCTALAISNSITNLCATLFGQVWRLEPLQPEKKLMWRREMDWLLCVSDHIIELTPSWQTSPDGNKLEVMNSRPRSDLIANLPALRKLDNMLLEILDSFRETEFWYVDHGVFPRHQDKWWLPVPRVPPGGLNENARNSVQHRRDCANQILKAATAINSAALAEMDVPDSYLEALPKNGKASLGDVIHRCINSERFSPELLLDCLVLSSEHQALEIANKVEGAVYIWRRFRTTNLKPCLVRRAQRSSSRSSWEMVKDLVSDADRREMLAGRAESLLGCLRQRFPGLPQTALDMSKIQSNKDVGKSLLESYSRVLESMSFNIVARIDDLLHVDDLSKQSDQLRQLVSSGYLKKGHPSVLSS